MKKEMYLINSKSIVKNQMISALSSAKKEYHIVCEKHDVSMIIKRYFAQGYRTFVVCGGDGSVNIVVNSLLKLDKKTISRITLGVSRGGKANDFAQYMNMPLALKSSWSKLRTIKVDVIKVNDKVFLTGGGFGFPAYMIEDFNKHSSRFLIASAKGNSYLLFALKMMLFHQYGLSKVVINNKKYHNVLGVFLLNQPFIGKRFKFSSGSRNTDGIFECFIIQKGSRLRDVYNLSKAVFGGLQRAPQVLSMTQPNLSIAFDSKQPFMADGEILLRAKSFKIRVLPRTIRFYRK